MDRSAVIWTEKNNCQDCYKCLRECSVKAIKIEDASASVLNDLCIHCGHCVEVCPFGAKKTRSDIPKVLALINSGEKVIISLAPSYVSEFPDVSPAQLIATFKKMGFYGVSETALGAEKAAAETRAWLDKQEKGIYIGSSCPSAVEYLGKYSPNALPFLAPIHSPMVCHGAMLKVYYGDDVKVVFMGPCFAKKTESDLYKDKIDYAVTFVGLKRLFTSLKIDPKDAVPTADDVFIPQQSKRGDLFPVDGGMLYNMHSEVKATDTDYMSFSGIREIQSILKDVDNLKNQNRKLFIEPMICSGGCIQGPAKISKESVATKRLRVLSSNAKKTPGPTCEEFEEKAKTIDVFRTYEHLKNCEQPKFGDDEIRTQLQNLNKFTEKDELNCGGCGYDDCRTLARAILSGYAERQMCVAYMRGVANDKASVLLRRIPYGVVMVDDHLKIVDSNTKFAELCGEEVVQINESNPGLAGADLTKIIHSHKFFSTVLTTGEDMVNQDIRDGDLYYNISIVSIQKHRMVVGIIQNMREPEVQKELVLNRTRRVITENMKVVQQIAYLLGENASFTETMLNSIVESHNTDSEEK